MTLNIILTRPIAEIERSRPLYEARGFSVYPVSLVELLPTPIAPNQLDGVFRWKPEAMLLTSSAAARRWFEEAGSRLSVLGCRWLVVGERAAEVVAERNPGGTILTVQPDGRGLLEWFDAQGGEVPRRILYPCSARRTDALVAGLRGRGAEVAELPLYQPALPADAPEQLRATLHTLAGSSIVCVFHSPSAVLNFFRYVGEAPVGAIFAAIGSTTAAPLRERGLDPIVPERPTDADLAEAILNRFSTPPPNTTA